MQFIPPRGSSAAPNKRCYSKLLGTLIGSESLGSSDTRNDHLAANRRSLVSGSWDILCDDEYRM